MSQARHPASPSATPSEAPGSPIPGAEPLFECVPNISEGRDEESIARFAAALRRGGATLLHQTSDPDHHRTVFTLAGTPATLGRSLEALFEVATAAIDLRRHRGVHPRIGAVDVAPFVPLDTLSPEGVAATGPASPLGTMEGARRLAWSVGERLAERFAVPVLFYDEAARTPRRRNLADLRRGGFEALTNRLAAEPPDAGPPRPHPTAGASAIGARFFLVAFNMVLDTAEIRLARRIAATIRQANGGLPGVKALGLPLASRGLTQVSTNLVDYRLTSPHRVVDTVCREARALGVEMVESELIGLIPRAALADGPLEDLRLEGFDHTMVLEHRLQSSGLLAAELPRTETQSRLPPSNPARQR